MKAIIVGGSSGIGEATARMFVRAGAEVVIAGRDRARLEQAVERIGKVRGETADGTEAVSVKNLFESIETFDHLVLAMSGARGGGPIAGLPLGLWRSAKSVTM